MRRNNKNTKSKSKQPFHYYALKTFTKQEPVKQKQHRNTFIIQDKKYRVVGQENFNLFANKYWAEIVSKNPPPRRTEHVSFIYEDTFYIFGGRGVNNTKLNDMWKILKYDHWVEIKYTGEGPPPISEHKGEIIGDKFYVFGGLGENLIVYNTLYIFDIPKESWTKKEFDLDEVPPRCGHSLSIYEKDDKQYLIIFGGQEQHLMTNSVLKYLIKDENKKEDLKDEWKIYDCLNGPAPRFKHSQVTYKDKIIIYGGSNSEGECYNDIWEFDLITETWNKIILNECEVPKPRKGHTAIVRGDSMYIFGGMSKVYFEMNEFWKLDLKEKKSSLIHRTMLETLDKEEVEYPRKTQPLFDYINLTEKYEVPQDTDKKKSLKTRKKFTETILYTDNSKYEGTLNSKSGFKIRGKFIFSNGDSYDGEFNKENLFNGTGVYKWKNGDIYEGDFDNGKIQGFGNIKYYIGDLYNEYDEYEGYFKDNKKNGKGTYKEYLSAAKYSGDFKDDLYDGIGIMKKENGDEVYEGKFEKAKKVEVKDNNPDTSQKENLTKVTEKSEIETKKNNITFKCKMKEYSIKELEKNKFLLADKNVKQVLYSNIYKLKPVDQNFIDEIFKSNIGVDTEQSRIKFGDVPLQRVGHSANLYHNVMFIFGGDMHQYQFNEVFMFDFIRYEYNKEFVVDEKNKEIYNLPLRTEENCNEASTTTGILNTQFNITYSEISNIK